MLKLDRWEGSQKHNSYDIFYVFDSDMEAHVKMRRCGTNGLERETVVIILHVLNPVNSFIEMFPRAGKFIRNQEVCKVRFVSHGS